MPRGLAVPSSAAVTAAAAGVFLLTFLWRLLTFVGFSNDDYVHLAYAQQLLLGEWPIRDFIDPGMPLMYLLSAGAQAVGGERLGSELVLAAAGLSIGAALTVVAGTMLAGSLPVGLLAALLEVAIYPRNYSYPKVLVYAAAAVALLAAARQPSSRRFFLLGVVVSVAFLFRHDHGVYTGAASATLALLVSRGDAAGAWMRRLAALSAGTVPIILPWLLYVQVQEGLVSYFRSALEFSQSEATSGLLSWPAFDLSASGLLSPGNAEAWWDPLESTCRHASLSIL